MIFTFKRILKDTGFLLLLAGIVIISLLAFKAGESVKTPPYGYACEASGEDADRLCSEFDSAGFVRCSSPEELYEEIGAAHLDCGIIVGADFSERIKTGELEGALTLVTSPETLLPELCRIEAVSVITAIYAPYVTTEALEGAVDYRVVKETYDNMLSEGALFNFEIENASGTEIINDTRSRNLFKGALAIMVFIAAWIGCCRPAYRHACDMRSRMGMVRSCLRVSLPEVFVRLVMIAAAAVIACLLANQTGLIPVSLVYTLIVVGAGIPVVMILPDSWILIITVFVMILSLGLCPVFTDLAEVIPALGAIRKALLPYLMWEIVL